MFYFLNLYFYLIVKNIVPHSNVKFWMELTTYANTTVWCNHALDGIDYPPYSLV